MSTEAILNNIPNDAPIQLPQSTLQPVQPFNPEMLPDAVKDYVLDVSDRQQSPPDFVAVAAMCGLSAVLGRKALIRPKKLDDWAVTPNQWGQIIGRPSAMKSPSIKEALKPLTQLEALSAQTFTHQNRRYTAEKKLYELEQEANKSRAKKLVKSGDRDGALNILEQIEIDKAKPTRKRIIVNDATVEKLGELLNENPNGLILVRDELSGWLSKLAKEENQAERAFYLECFDGNGRFTYDRIGRGTIEIKNCTLSVIGGIQPSKICPLLRDAVRGTADDGLVQRLQLTVWPDDITNWEWRDRAPNKIARNQYVEAFTKLHAFNAELEDSEPHYFQFSDKAQVLFIGWMEDLQAYARKNDINPALESHLLKMPQTIAGLALLIELVDGGRFSVGLRATMKAINWAEYLISHAERMYSSVLNTGLEGAHLILKRKDKLPTQFTSRVILRKGWIGLNTPDVVEEALEYLVEYRYLQPMQTTSNSTDGGRPTTHYYWNT